jgi:hypothetical protein
MAASIDVQLHPYVRVGTGDVILLPVILLPAIVIVKIVWLPGIIVWADADILLEFIPASTITTNITATIVTSRVKICFIAYVIRGINSKIVYALKSNNTKLFKLLWAN